jgi:hypothetical protein
MKGGDPDEANSGNRVDDSGGSRRICLPAATAAGAEDYDRASRLSARTGTGTTSRSNSCTGTGAASKAGFTRAALVSAAAGDCSVFEKAVNTVAVSR